jgi:23S rRNA (guanine2445-N2)-methyltransferase / 23S rRNA (guanine2069-N7)-methyltransferase
MPHTLALFATTAKGMEELLAAELQALGASAVEVRRAGASFAGSLEAAYRVCLWSRVANRVLLPLATFPAPTPQALYEGVRTIHWSDHLDARRTLAVDCATSHSAIAHSHYGALKTKDAIVDQCA